MKITQLGRLSAKDEEKKPTIIVVNQTKGSKVFQVRKNQV